MPMPLFLPLPEYVARLSPRGALPLRALCAAAGVPCRASGPWIERPIVLDTGAAPRLRAEPGGRGVVRIDLPPAAPQARARLALAILAYSLHDLVARQSIAHAPWSKLGAPRGRPRTGHAVSAAHRQRRARTAQRLQEAVAQRGGPPSGVPRRAP